MKQRKKEFRILLAAAALLALSGCQSVDNLYKYGSFQAPEEKAPAEAEAVVKEAQPPVGAKPVVAKPPAVVETPKATKAPATAQIPEIEEIKEEMPAAPQTTAVAAPEPEVSIPGIDEPKATPPVTKAPEVEEVDSLEDLLGSGSEQTTSSSVATSAAAAGAAAAGAVAASEAPRREQLPSYEPQAKVSGRLRSIGSDTMDRLMADWEAAFKKNHRGIIVIHEGRGTSTAIPGLIEGRSDFGPMSREVRDTEITKFRERFGYEPVQVASALDALAIYVHPSNPIAERGLTIEEIDAIFSDSRTRGHPDIKTWGDLGLTGEWANAPITLYSRNKASGTRSFFDEVVLRFGRFKDAVVDLPGSADVVEAVSNDRFGIGYSGVGYQTDFVAMVPVAASIEGEMMEPSEANALSGAYPLARFLYLAINLKPGENLPPLQREFLRFVYSVEGQKLVEESGFYQLSRETIAKEQAKVGL